MSHICNTARVITRPVPLYDGTNWGVSLTDHNPSPRNFVECENQDHALELCEVPIPVIRRALQRRNHDEHDDWEEFPFMDEMWDINYWRENDKARITAYPCEFKDGTWHTLTHDPHAII